MVDVVEIVMRPDGLFKVIGPKPHDVFLFLTLAEAKRCAMWRWPHLPTEVR